MKISIVVPIYNAEQYLTECIESVVNQTNENWELILVNDGSTDKSAEICDAYATKYQRKIFAYHKKNEGQYLTRVFGINKASGEYVGFLDADDSLESVYVDTLLKNVKKSDILCFGFCEWRENSKKFVKLPIDDLKKYYANDMDLQCIYSQIINGELTGSMCLKVFKTSLMKSISTDSEEVCTKRYGEDAYQSFYAISKAKSITYLNYPLYCYRINLEGASAGYESRMLDYFNTRYVFEMLYANILNDNNSDLRERLIARNFNETVYHMLKFYRSADSSKRRREIVSHDWSEYLISMTESQFMDNKYIRKAYIKVWNAFRNQKYLEIYIREKFKRFIGW